VAPERRVRPPPSARRLLVGSGEAGVTIFIVQKMVLHIFALFQIGIFFLLFSRSNVSAAPGSPTPFSDPSTTLSQLEPPAGRGHRWQRHFFAAK
jgi:hypothetical protein